MRGEAKGPNLSFDAQVTRSAFLTTHVSFVCARETQYEAGSAFAGVAVGIPGHELGGFSIVVYYTTTRFTCCSSSLMLDGLAADTALMGRAGLSTRNGSLRSAFVAHEKSTMSVLRIALG
jgi:hypothetical protein